MIKKLAKQFAALAVCVGLAQVAKAANYDPNPVFSQSFENSETYTQEVSDGSVASTILGIEQSTSTGKPGTYSNATRTIYGTTTDSKFLRADFSGGSNSGKADAPKYLLFSMPSEVLAIKSYKLEFDYFHTAASWNGSASKSGLVITGGDGAIATFYSGSADSNTESSNGYVYNGDDASSEIVGNFKYGIRYSDPADYNKAAYWYHVTLESDEDNGLWITVKRANDTITYKDHYPIADKGTCVKSLLIYSTAKNDLSRFAGLDNVAVYKPVATRTYTWTGAAEDGLWTTPGNWSVDNVQQTVYYPQKGDTASIGANAAIFVPSDLEFGTVSADANVTLKVMFNAEGESFTAPTGFTGKVAYTEPFTVNAEGKSVRNAATFKWCGGSGAFVDTTKWTVSGNPVCVYPVSGDAITNDTVSTINCNQTCSIGAAHLGAELTLTRSNGGVLKCPLFDGAGKIRMNGGYVQYTDGDLIISNNVEVVADSTSYIRMGNSTAYGKKAYLYGNLTGSGNLTADHGGCQGVGVVFGGTNDLFRGTYEDINYNQRDSSSFSSAEGTSSNAVWKINSATKSVLDNVLPCDFTETAYFGAYVGAIQTGGRDRSIEVGYRSDTDSNIDVRGHTNYGNLTIRKIGDGYLNLHTSNGLRLGDLTLVGGVTHIADPITHVDKIVFAGGTLQTGYALVPDSADDSITNAVPIDVSAYITNSTSAIVFDDQGTNVTWATALADSNTAGLTKKGAGTLTLSKKPAWTEANKATEVITVEAGTLIIADKTFENYTLSARTSVYTNSSDQLVFIPTPYEVGSTDYICFTNTYLIAADKCGVDTGTYGDADGYVMGDDASQGATFQVAINNTTKGDYLLMFKEGISGCTATYKVTVSNGLGYEVTRTYTTPDNVGSWKPTHQQALSCQDMPVGLFTLTFENISISSRYAGNFGYFKFVSPIAVPTSEAINLTSIRDKSFYMNGSNMKIENDVNLGSTYKNYSFWFELDVVTASDYRFAYKFGSENSAGATITWTLVNQATGTQVTSMTDTLTSTGSWTPSTCVTNEFVSLAKGIYELKGTITAPDSGYAGNYGSFEVVKGETIDNVPVQKVADSTAMESAMTSQVAAGIPSKLYVVGTGDTATTNTCVAVMNQPATTIIGVPCTNMTVATLLDVTASGIQANDELYVYKNGAYVTYRWDGSAWQNKDYPTGETAAECKVDIGAAAFVKRADATNPIVQIGGYSEGVSNVTAAADANLVAPATMADYDLNDDNISNANTGDEIKVVNGSNYVTYDRDANGEWGTDELTGTTTKYGHTVPVYTRKKADKVPAGQGFFYLKTGSNTPSIKVK